MLSANNQITHITTFTKVAYILSIFQTYWKYISKVYLEYISSIVEACFKYTSSIYFKYTSNILQPIEVNIILTKEGHLKHVL